MSLAFKNFIAIDWSGAKKPVQTTAIALAHCRQDQDAPQTLAHKLSRQCVFDYLVQQAQSPDISLVGIDANLGYAQNMAVQLCGPHGTPAQLWQMVDTICVNSPNFFGGPMWQHPNFETFFWAQGKQPQNWLPQYYRRVTETACSQQGLGYPENPFKLIGPKQVGKGGLAAMRLLHQLKTCLGDKLCVWPFELPNANTSMVLVEIYPRLFLQQMGFGTLKLRNLTNLNKVLAGFNAQAFNSPNAILTDHLADALVAAAGMRFLAQQASAWPKLPKRVGNEGWIFGVNSPYN